MNHVNNIFILPFRHFQDKFIAFKMTNVLLIFSLLFLCSWPLCVCSNNITTGSFIKSYESGVNAYLDEDWEKCIEDMETSIHLYKLTLTAIADCRIKCLNEPHDQFIKKDIEDLKFFEKIVKRTLCFVKCKRIRYPNVVFDFPDDEEGILTMENLKPYEYLQICYLKNDQFQKAASAAFTYFVKNPEDKQIKSNFDYYLTLPEVNPRDITNYELPEYVPLYFHGMNSYNNENWGEVIQYMKEALASYIANEDRCRALCEGSFDQGWLPDFITSIANHFTYSLKCKRKCPDKLKMIDGKQGKEILADIYNYLQFSFYKNKQYFKAYRCVASYLIIYPNDEAMIQNKKFYSEKAQPEDFTPYSDILHYLQREEYESNLLQFIQQSFVAEFEIQKSKVIEEDSDIKTNEI